jgi:hypothetical protein
MDAPHSATHVVFSPTGRVVAIIHVYPGSSDDLRHLVRNDVTPDSPRPGAQYAQINNATTSNPFIDRTTDMLLWTLMQSVQAMGDGFGANFGTAVHTDFAKRVRQLDLPGIGQDGVEQTFHPKILLRHPRLLRYGLSGSIRTDVILRDPKDPRQRPIAVYDLKTGNAYLTPRRIQKIKDYVKEPEIIVIELRYGTVESLVR